VIRTRELVRFLLKNGYRRVRQAGSHLILDHPERPMLVIPVHAGDLPKGLAFRILKDAGFTIEQFRSG
jgi:predicted RNA binding protein YcfA (HicA-like mRNA interferase family)